MIMNGGAGAFLVAIVFLAGCSVAEAMIKRPFPEPIFDDYRVAVREELMKIEGLDAGRIDHRLRMVVNFLFPFYNNSI
jgi:hypothetical protein